MGLNVKVSTKSVADASKAFDYIGAQLTGEAVSDAVSFSAAPMVEAIRRNAKAIADSGALANSIDTKEVHYKKEQATFLVIGPNVDYSQEVTRTTKLPNGTTFMRKETAIPANYAHLVEFGTSAHRLGEKPNSAQHPGARELPFMRTGFDSSSGEVVDRFGNRFGKSILRVARKSRGRFGRSGSGR